MPTGMMLSWGLTETLCYLRHLERRGEADTVEGEAAGALGASGLLGEAAASLTETGAPAVWCG